MNNPREQTEVFEYEKYIECLNARDWNSLEKFVAVGVVHNARPLGLDGYRAMLEENVRDIPDLQFNVDLIVTKENDVAVRLRFDCRPVKEFLGVPVDGRRIVFHEHAFYKLKGGKIDEVFSIIDKAAVEAQVRP